MISLQLLKSKINSKYFVLFLTFTLFFHHFSLLFLTSFTHKITIQNILGNWDSAWYSSIVQNSYDNTSIAFFPLYPLCVKILSILTINYIPINILGTIFSSILFIIFCYFIHKLFSEKEKHPSWLIPQTNFGFFFFIYGPASYIFHTNHTESLFLLLSFFALYFSNKNWILASIFAGFCSLTKNQGVILAIIIAALCSSNINSKGQKIKIFVSSGIISGLIFIPFLIYQYLKFSTPFAFIYAQENWGHQPSLIKYFSTFLEILRYKDISKFYIYEIILYYTLLMSTILIFKKSKLIFLYAISLLLLNPLQGNLITVFRFTIFIFPLYFSLGDFISKRNKIIILIIFILAIYINHQMTRNYYLSRWCY